MSAAVVRDVLEPYRTAFEVVRAAAGDTAAVREQAFARFEELGLPTPRDDAWKYTSLRRLESRRFVTARRATLPAAVPSTPALAPHRVTILNGHLVERTSLPTGIQVRSLAEALGAGEPPSRAFRVPVGGGTERFAALNAASCDEVVFIDIEAGAAPAEALHLVIASSGAEPVMSHPRVIIRAGAASAARIVLQHAGDHDGEHFVNSYVEVEADADATLHLYRLQTAGARSFLIERVEATLGGRATLEVHDAELEASLSRLDLHARLAAPRASATLTGLFLADGARHLDAHVRVDHFAPDTQSFVDYRGIAAGRGRGVFNGKAVVHVDAQRSQARQTNRNLLLSAGAEIDSKPELEIYADDVQCGHGSTTGQLDPAALFYLRSRGLDEHEARSALTRAFAGAVLSRMDLASFAGAVHDALEVRLARLLEERA